MQIQEVDVAQVLDLDPGVPGDVEVLEALRHRPDHPGQDPPGEDTGAGRVVFALRVEAGHHARAVAHHAAVTQADADNRIY